MDKELEAIKNRLEDLPSNKPKQPQIGRGTKIWQPSNIHHTAKVGENCVIGAFTELGAGVVVGNNCKIQAFAFIAAGTQIEDNVFIGPHAAIANDKYPSAVTQEGILKTKTDWHLYPVRIRKGASIGINATIGAGLTIGKNSMVGAAANVTQDVPNNCVVCGNPAKIHNKREDFSYWQ